MKLVTFSADSEERKLGAVYAGRVYDLVACAKRFGAHVPSDTLTLISRGEAALAEAADVLARAVREGLPSLPEHHVTLHAPLMNPPKILALAGNYQAHIQEGGEPPVDKTRVTPQVFMKPITTLCGHKAFIPLPDIAECVDYELEMAVVIGRAGKSIPVDCAMQHVAGYSVYNDISSRRLVIAQGRGERKGNEFFDWLNGKWQDNFGPMGPYLVTADEIADPMNLNMKLWVNDELRQDANTGLMIFNIAEIVSFISRLMTLQPGDVIATGTPSGVGDARGVYLKAGDVIRCEIDGLGVLENQMQ